MSSYAGLEIRGVSRVELNKRIFGFFMKTTSSVPQEWRNRFNIDHYVLPPTLAITLKGLDSSRIKLAIIIKLVFFFLIVKNWWTFGSWQDEGSTFYPVPAGQIVTTPYTRKEDKKNVENSNIASARRVKQLTNIEITNINNSNVFARRKQTITWKKIYL